jgi:UDP-glucuronate decarboxylase
MSTNILITGGAGFIGRNLIEELLTLKTTNKIIILDNFVTSNKQEFLSFIKKFPENMVLFYSYDITNSHLIDYLVKDLKERSINTINEIYHLASLASPPFYKKYPIETLDVGYIGTKNMLELAKLYDAKILFSSTSEVYGDALVSPQHENYYGNVNSFGERSCYDESKRVAEALCYTYLKSYGVDVKIARIFNTYGPHMLLNDGRIITEVIRHLKNGTTLTIYGDGNQTRSCCYVKDTVDMLIKLMASYCNDPVNIGNNQERNINETVNIIENVWNQMSICASKLVTILSSDLTGIVVTLTEHTQPTQLNRVYKPLTQNDPLQRKPCLEFNKQVLGEIEYTSFEEGIKETINYFTQ